MRHGPRDLDVSPTPDATWPNITGMIAGIRKLIAMIPAIVIPGHGEIQHDTAYLQLLDLAFTTYEKAAEEAIAEKVPHARGVIYGTYLAAGAAPKG